MVVIDLNSDSSNDAPSNKITEEEKEKPVYQVARKSTGGSSSSLDKRRPSVNTRRQAALANKEKHDPIERFMENFDPDRSVRERRKLSRKINTTRRHPGALYDELGIHIASDVDMCDCLQKICTGCHFPCEKCKSLKCGIECRVNRKYVYDQIEYQGCDLVIKNPLSK